MTTLHNVMNRIATNRTKARIMGEIHSDTVSIPTFPTIRRPRRMHVRMYVCMSCHVTLAPMPPSQRSS